MQMTWQAWVWIAIFAAIGAATGYFTTWWVGLLVFVLPIVGFTIWLGVAMNTDI